MTSSTNKKWLEGHSTETPAELMAKRATHDDDSILYAFQRAVERMYERFGPGALNEYEMNLLAVCAFEREINNGGYIQFFENTSKHHAPYIVRALQAIGATSVAVITQEAIQVLAIDGELTVEVLDSLFEHDDDKRDDKLASLDSRFYKEGQNLCGPTLTYIETNLEHFEFKIMGRTSRHS